MSGQLDSARGRICGRAVVACLGMTAGSANAEVHAYQLEPSHADVLFAVDHVGFSLKHGCFRDIKGNMTFSAGQPERSQVSITIGADSVDTADPQRDSELRGANFFDVVRYPSIRFDSSRIIGAGNEAYRVEGLLTMHGVTKAITLEARINKVGNNPFSRKPTVGFTAIGTVRRSDFAIGRWVPMIGDEVFITIDVEFSQ